MDGSILIVDEKEETAVTAIFISHMQEVHFLTAVHRTPRNRRAVAVQVLQDHRQVAAVQAPQDHRQTAVVV